MKKLYTNANCLKIAEFSSLRDVEFNARNFKKVAFLYKASSLYSIYSELGFTKPNLASKLRVA